MPRAPDFDQPFPSLDPTSSIPLGLARLQASAAARDWSRRSDPDHWLNQIDYQAVGCSLEDAATFIWSLRSAKAWIGSPQQGNLYKLASKRVHFLPRGMARLHPLLARTVNLYSTRGGQRIEALSALGFALSCGRSGHSLKCWGIIAEQIVRNGLGRTDPKLNISNAAEQHFKALRSRLNTARDEWGTDELHKAARKTFAAFHSSGFSKV